ncbi:MAG TPA: hypothetical protein VGN17_05970 [Bryobacteraceae bacterium]|jgi:hypothetical protein
MTNTLRVFAYSLAVGIVLSVASKASAQTVPTDAQLTCTVTAPVFASWFQSGMVAPNGVVNPANSVTFPNVPNCSFYQWSKQMFLWLTSPAPVTYGGGGGRIFDSPTFFDVSPPDASGQRTFIPHTPGLIRNFGVRAAQVGPHGLPVAVTRAGTLVEVESVPIAPSGNQLIRNRAGSLVEVARATVANGKISFLDTAGKAIQPLVAPAVKALSVTAAKNQLSTLPTLQRLLIRGKTIFVDPSGNVVEVDEGQAGGGDVLQAQVSANGSLVYFVTIVNDVYTYFLTGAKDGGITPAPTQFPTTAADLAKVVTFAAAHGKTFPDPNALAIEVKSSWVEAAGLPNASTYITMTANIPTFDKTNPALWVPNGQKSAMLGLVGVHVVGSTAGHPEMIWATFEHFNNTPNGAYQYNATSGTNPKTVPQSTAGTWLFSANGATAPFNTSHMRMSAANLQAISPNNVTPSNTIRWKAWGAAFNLAPNPLDPTPAASNTEIISIHNSISSMMPAGDLRNNYVMSGATWTIGGAAPTNSNQVGTSMLTNTTMETYQQGTSNQTPGTNCFSCHTSNTTGVSHIFGGPSTGLKPLF